MSAWTGATPHRSQQVPFIDSLNICQLPVVTNSGLGTGGSPLGAGYWGGQPGKLGSTSHQPSVWTGSPVAGRAAQTLGAQDFIA
jgi:hypothetical protein